MNMGVNKSVAYEIVASFEWLNNCIDKNNELISRFALCNLVGRLQNEKKKELINYKITDKLEKQLKRNKKKGK
jgi:hypothetical protein